MIRGRGRQYQIHEPAEIKVKMKISPVVVSVKVIVVDTVLCMVGSVGSTNAVVSSSAGEETLTFSAVMWDVISSVWGTADDVTSSPDVLGIPLSVLVGVIVCVQPSTCSGSVSLDHLAETWNRTAPGTMEKLPWFNITASSE